MVALRERMAYKRKPDDRKWGQKATASYCARKSHMPATPDVPFVGDGKDEAAHNQHVKALKAECKRSCRTNLPVKRLQEEHFLFIVN